MKFDGPPDQLSSSGRTTIVDTISRDCREVYSVSVDKMVWRCKRVTERANSDRIPVQRSTPLRSGGPSARPIYFTGWRETAMHRDPIIISDVWKCLAVIDTSLVLIDVIQYQNKFWLVPEWLDSPDGQWSRPRRIISVKKLQRYDLKAIGTEAADFALDETLAEDVLTGACSSGKASKYQIIDLPALRFRKPQLH